MFFGVNMFHVIKPSCSRIVTFITAKGVASIAHSLSPYDNCYDIYVVWYKNSTWYDSVSATFSLCYFG